MEKNIDLFIHTRTGLADGLKIMNSPKHIASDFCYAKKGDIIELTNKKYVFAVGTYSFERDLKFKEEYSYLPESAWLKYNKDLEPTNYKNLYVFDKDCYYKICFKRIDGKDFVDRDLGEIKSCISFSPTFRKRQNKPRKVKKVFENEILQMVSEVNMQAYSLKLIILTDTHNSINGTWYDTEMNIQAVVNKSKPDAIIHLGDLTDGITSRKTTLELAREVLEGLENNKVPLYMTLGNHDANYFKQNHDILTIEEQSKLYLDRDLPYYYVDIKGVRMIFLSAYDNNNKYRYGFSGGQVLWLEQVLSETNTNIKVMIFSHDAPLQQLDYWSSHIYNGDRVIEILEKDNKKYDRILCFIHGHTHADYIYRDLSFPIVSIGCNKCEDFGVYKPDGSVTQSRKFDSVTQDLWDYLVYSKENNSINLLRFGAGEDRRVI